MIDKKVLLPAIVEKAIKEGESAYANIIRKGAYEYTYYDLDCSQLPPPDYSKVNSLVGNKIDQDFICKLPVNEKPCLYYFEIKNLNKENILKAYRAYQKKQNEKKKKGVTFRVTAALKLNPPDSRFLYVGKVKHHIMGRMVVHLGYYHVGATAGLNLVNWAKDIGLILTVHIFSFDKEMEQYVSALEQPLARHLHPIIGKH